MKIKAVLLSPYFYLLLAAVAIRYIGIGHSFPFVYNVDEPTLVKTAMGLRFGFWIERFDWPHFNYYFHYLFYFLFIKARALAQVAGIDAPLKSLMPLLWDDPFVFYFISRFINTTLSIIAAYPVYYISKNLYGRRIGYFAGLIFILFPYLGQNSRYAIQDTAMTSWLAFYYLFVFIYWKTKKNINLLWAGIFIGLAAGVKYNAVLFFGLVPLLLAFVVNFKNPKSIMSYGVKNIMVGVVMTLIFLLTSLTILKEYQLFFSDKSGVGIMWQLKTNLDTYSLLELPQQFLLDYWNLLIGTGFVLGIGWLLFPIIFKKVEINRDYKIFLISIWIVSFLYAVYASRYVLSGPRFYTPIYPLVAIIGASWFYYYSKYKYTFKLILGYSIVMLVFAAWQAYSFFIPSTLNLAVDRYNEISKAGQAYIVGEDLERLNALNNTKLKMLKSDHQTQAGEYIISTRPLAMDNIVQEEILLAKTGLIKRIGPDIYIYKIQ